MSYVTTATQLHKTWRIPYVGRGAYGSSNGCGHFFLLGTRYCWAQSMAPDKWAGGWSISFWGIVALNYGDTQGGTLDHCNPAGLSVTWCSFVRPQLTFLRKAKTYAY